MSGVELCPTLKEICTQNLLKSKNSTSKHKISDNKLHKHGAVKATEQLRALLSTVSMSQIRSYERCIYPTFGWPIRPCFLQLDEIHKRLYG